MLLQLVQKECPSLVSPFLPLNIFVTISNIFRWIKENVPDWAQAVVASPDEGGTRRAGQFCGMCGNWWYIVVLYIYIMWRVSSVVCVVTGEHCGIIHLHNVAEQGGQVS